MKIGVAYAAYVTNQQLLRYAVETLESITSAKHKLSFAGYLNHSLDAEGRAELERFGPLYENDENCLGRAWNRGIDRLLREGCRYVFVPNLDIICAPGALDALVAGAKSRPKSILWTMSTWHDQATITQAVTHDAWVPHPHFSAFMVDARLFREVGPFDERFKPAYDEDLDMHWRIRLAGHDASHYEGARFFHHGSMTIRHDPDLGRANNATHATNSAYFRMKWGYKPPTADDPFTEKMFRYPFNDPDKVGIEREVIPTWRSP